MNKIGVILPDSSNLYFSSLAHAFQRELSKKNIAVIALDSSTNKAHELRNIKVMDALDVHALIFISVGDNPDSFILLNRIDIPILVLDREIPIEKADFLISNDHTGIKTAITYLESKGHSQIGFIDGDLNTEPGRVRHNTFIEWGTKNSGTYFNHITFDGDFTASAGVRAANTFTSLSDELRPTAVIAANDLMALGFMFELSRLGYSVPNDVSLIGYDDIDICSWVHPKLTSIRQDVMEISKIGIELLLSRASNPQSESRIKTYTPRLIERNSVLKI